MYAIERRYTATGDWSRDKREFRSVNEARQFIADECAHGSIVHSYRVVEVKR